jgi:hypothetical protein
MRNGSTLVLRIIVHDEVPRPRHPLVQTVLPRNDWTILTLPVYFRTPARVGLLRSLRLIQFLRRHTWHMNNAARLSRHTK